MSRYLLPPMLKTTRSLGRILALPCGVVHFAIPGFERRFRVPVRWLLPEFPQGALGNDPHGSRLQRSPAGSERDVRHRPHTPPAIRSQPSPTGYDRAAGESPSALPLQG